MNTRNLVAFLTVVLLAGCAAWKQKPAVPPAPAPASAAGLIADVRARGDAVRRLDAVLEARMDGAPAGGRLFGTLQVEDAAADGLALRLQAYTITGMPVLDVVARGQRFELFSPLEQRTYLNFNGLPGAGAADDFPLALFNETTLPVGLLLEQFGLFWGRGLGPAELTATPEGFILYERDNGALVRQTEWSRDLRLLRVKLFQEGDLYGGMECGEYKGQGPNSILPAHLELYQGELRIELDLSRVRTNGEVTAPAVGFRAPTGRVILLTPPVAALPPGAVTFEVPAPEPPATDAPEAGSGTTAEPLAAPIVDDGSTAGPAPSPVAGSTAAASESPAEPPAEPPPEPLPGAPVPVLPD